MAENFYMILTTIGQAKIANAQVTGQKVNLTEIAVGDAGGSYYNPEQTQTALRNEVWRGNIGAVKVDEENQNWIVIEGVIPANVGGFFVREVGIFDEDGDMVAVGKIPETYKPVMDQGSAKDLYLRVIIEVTNASAVTLRVDPSVIIASRKYVDEAEARANSYTDIKTSQIAAELGAHLNDKLQDGVHGLATTQDLTLYVDATNGDDSNDGLTPQTAFRTIHRAIDVLPKIIDHNVIIQLVDGTYNENVSIIGFNGKGKLFIKGNNTNPTNVKVRSFAIGQNTCFVEVMDCEVTATDTNGISISDSGAPVLVSRVIIQTPSSVAAGIGLSFGVTSITQCTISNRYLGIVGYNLSRIHSYNNGGSGNTFGLYIGEGSVLAKNGSQPTGTTNEYTWAGGVIR